MNNHLQSESSRSRRSGQAAIELALGSLIIIFLFVCGLFYLKVAAAHRRMVTEMRVEAGVRAQDPGTAVELADYLITWDNGVDEIAYTADDRPFPYPPPPSTTLANIANRSVRDQSDWDGYIRDLPNPTPIYGLHENPQTMLELRLVRAEDSDTLYPDAEDDPQGWFTWLYGRDHVHVKHTVWMPVMTGPIDPDNPPDPGQPSAGGFL